MDTAAPSGNPVGRDAGSSTSGRVFSAARKLFSIYYLEITAETKLLISDLKKKSKGRIHRLIFTTKLYTKRIYENPRNSNNVNYKNGESIDGVCARDF